MHRFSLAETFVCIDGEETRAGTFAVFLRFPGCNLQCGFCNTAWANAADTPVTEMTTQQLVAYVQKTGVRNVTLTGGEPLLQPQIETLITALGALGYSVEIETNGSVVLDSFAALAFRPNFTMDYKLLGIGMESHMRTENFALLQVRDAVKFVVGSVTDLERVTEILRTYALTAHCTVFFSPVFGSIVPKDIVAYMIEHQLSDVRLQLQLHKYIWDPQKRGV